MSGFSLRLIFCLACWVVLLTGCSQWFNKASDNITLSTAPSSQISEREDVSANHYLSSADVKVADKATSGSLRLPSVVAQTARQQTYAYQVITSSNTSSGCKPDQCSKVSVKLVAFDGKPKINAFLDQSLAAIGEVDSESKPPHRSIIAFKNYFLSTAKAGQTVTLESSVIRNSKELVVIQLDSVIFSGNRDALSTTQYLNWLPLADQLVTLEGMLLPDKSKDFQQLVLRQYEQWLKDHDDELGNVSEFKKIWPFVSTDNVALLDSGLRVSYDPVILAPRQFGRLSWIIPYGQLTDILRPELLPQSANKG
ncbi:hypothetical protein BCM14_0372 [Jezberella montanilacus]|uniref:DUF3298 domain-containing protein n=1 Tax=Jezberella montanilacus TaxID=323426 RepID=A0A2T0XJ27_9BURK|nr:RsiV family protein [Jezberella montanilacus]PRY98935.1 hypothetical protein BCM14_0372 [Jezberella montanilacus]